VREAAQSNACAAARKAKLQARAAKCEADLRMVSWRNYNLVRMQNARRPIVSARRQ
jgi:hypothetical protein